MTVTRMSFGSNQSEGWFSYIRQNVKTEFCPGYLHGVRHTRLTANDRHPNSVGFPQYRTHLKEKLHCVPGKRSEDLTLYQLHKFATYLKQNCEKAKKGDLQKKNVLSDT
jgi:hypothetical protein